MIFLVLLTDIRLYALGRKDARGGYKLYPAVSEMLRKKYLAVRHEYPTKDDECLSVLREDKFDFLDAGALALTPDGIQLEYVGAYAARACYGGITLSFAELMPFRNRDAAARLNWPY